MLEGTLIPLVPTIKWGLGWTSGGRTWEGSLHFHMTLNRCPDLLHLANQAATVYQASQFCIWRASLQEDSWCCDRSLGHTHSPWESVAKWILVISSSAPLSSRMVLPSCWPEAKNHLRRSENVTFPQRPWILTLLLKIGVWSLLTNKEEEKRVGGKSRKDSV